MPKKKVNNPFIPVKLEDPSAKEKVSLPVDAKYLKDVERFVKVKLRRASLQWPERNKAIQAARVERGMYRCAECSNLFGPKEGNLDHIQPVQPVGLEIPLIVWIYRLLCPLSNWQWLCKACHDAKTINENLLRKIRKRIK